MNSQFISPQPTAQVINLNDYAAVKPLFNGVGTIIAAGVDIDTNNDGKVSQTEWFTFGNVVLTRVLSNFNNAGVAFKALKTPTPAMRQAIVESFSEGFSIENKEAEGLVEDWLNWINQGVRLGERTSAFFRQKRAAKAA
jgi:hypothetical protein